LGIVSDLTQMKMQLTIVACVLACLACLAQSKGLQNREMNELPLVEISLAPPPQPWPYVSAELGKLEASREEFEQLMMGRVLKVAQKALRTVDQRIRVITDRLLRTLEDPAIGETLATRPSKWAKGHSSQHNGSVSFFARSTRNRKEHQDTVTVKVQSGAAARIDSIVAAIRGVEDERTEAEGKHFHQVEAEMNDLASNYISEFQAQVDKQVSELLSPPDGGLHMKSASFLQRSDRKQARFQVVASDIVYPTIAEMVSNMETRRDTAENLVQKRVATAELMFLQAANALARERLEAVIGVTIRRLKLVAK